MSIEKYVGASVLLARLGVGADFGKSRGGLNKLLGISSRVASR